MLTSTNDGRVIVTGGSKGIGRGIAGVFAMDSLAAAIPLKRLGSVDDIGHAALFFVSDAAAYVADQQIVVDGSQIIPESLGALEAM